MKQAILCPKCKSRILVDIPTDLTLDKILVLRYTQCNKCKSTVCYNLAVGAKHIKEE